VNYSIEDVPRLLEQVDKLERELDIGYSKWRDITTDAQACRFTITNTLQVVW